MRAAVRQMDLRVRANHCVLKLGRAMADLAGEEKIEVVRLAEAVQYRPPGIVVSCQWIRVLTISSNVHALLTDNQAVNSFKSALRFRSCSR